MEKNFPGLFDAILNLHHLQGAQPTTNMIGSQSAQNLVPTKTIEGFTGGSVNQLWIPLSQDFQKPQFCRLSPKLSRAGTTQGQSLRKKTGQAVKPKMGPPVARGSSHSQDTFQAAQDPSPRQHPLPGEAPALQKASQQKWMELGQRRPVSWQGHTEQYKWIKISYEVSFD